MGYRLTLKFADMWLYQRVGWLASGGTALYYAPASIHIEHSVGPEEQVIERCKGLIRDMEQRNYMLRSATLVKESEKGYPSKQVWEYDAPLAPKAPPTPIPLGEPPPANWSETKPVPFDAFEHKSTIGKP